MRYSILFAALAALTPFTIAQQTSTSSLAREAHQDRLGQIVRQLRQQVDAAAQGVPLASQARFAPVHEVLGEAEEALAALRIASHLDLPARRAECETAIARADRVWNDFRLVAPEREVSNGDGSAPPGSR